MHPSPRAINGQIRGETSHRIPFSTKYVRRYRTAIRPSRPMKPEDRFFPVRMRLARFILYLIIIGSQHINCYCFRARTFDSSQILPVAQYAMRRHPQNTNGGIEIGDAFWTNRWTGIDSKVMMLDAPPCSSLCISRGSHSRRDEDRGSPMGLKALFTNMRRI